jgi:hypothetical protein
MVGFRFVIDKRRIGGIVRRDQTVEHRQSSRPTYIIPNQVHTPCGVESFRVGGRPSSISNPSPSPIPSRSPKFKSIRRTNRSRPPQGFD